MSDKICTCCKEGKPVEFYRKSAKAPDGLSTQCVACLAAKQAVYYAKNAEYIKARNAAYAKPRLEQNTRYRQKWRKENPEKCLELDRRCRYSNPEAARARVRKCALKRKDKIREYARYYTPLRNARQEQASPLWLTSEHLDQMRRFYAECPAGYQVDHIYPLHGKTSCGLHVPWNLQYLTADDNRKKSNKLPEEYYGSTTKA